MDSLRSEETRIIKLEEQLEDLCSKNATMKEELERGKLTREEQNSSQKRQIQTLEQQRDRLEMALVELRLEQQFYSGFVKITERNCQTLSEKGTTCPQSRWRN